MQNLSYRYDSVGNITQIANSIAGETSVYDYDALDRLTNWQLNQDSPETYTYNAQGNLDVKNGLNLNYNDANHKHAVTHIGATQKYWYDNNGNQVTRIVGADTFDLAYDAENRLVEVKKNDVTISQFTYDGDGQRVKSVIDGETIRFVGGYYERKGSQITKYYMAGAARVAMRKYTIPQRMTVEYILGDHLGSTSITTDTNGALISEIRYKPWGETRYTSTNAPANTSPAYELVKYQYTGQYSYDVEFGLKYYNARWLDSTTGRFVQADTMIPQSQGTQAWDRFSYVNNNPVRFTDSSGHACDEDIYGYCLSGAAYTATVNITNPYGGHYSLGTRINSTTILTHNHYKGADYDIPMENLNVDGQWIESSDAIGPEIQGEPQTRLMTVGSSMAGPSAQLASPDTINSLKEGNVVQVAYWDDNANKGQGGMAVVPLSLAGPVNNGIMSFNNPNNLINYGDSGGGIFYNGQLIGNIWGWGNADGTLQAFVTLPPTLINSDTATTPVDDDIDCENCE